MLASATGAAIVLVVTLALRGSHRGSACRGALMPAYVSPHELVGLLALRELPRLIVVNPHNGPGVAARRSYRDAVQAAQKAGVRVLGYVATTYGARPAAAVQADIDRYESWYGVDGIFLDETASDAAELPYYRALSRHARAAGARLVVLNPGVVPARAYFDIADVVVAFEGPYAEYAAALERMPSWLDDIPPERIAYLVYDAQRAEAVAAARAAEHAAYVYATSGVQPNPWRTIPSYLANEEELSAACG